MSAHKSGEPAPSLKAYTPQQHTKVTKFLRLVALDAEIHLPPLLSTLGPLKLGPPALGRQRQAKASLSSIWSTEWGPGQPSCLNAEFRTYSGTYLQGVARCRLSYEGHPLTPSGGRFTFGLQLVTSLWEAMRTLKQDCYKHSTSLGHHYCPGRSAEKAQV